MSNSLDPDQARRIAGPDLGPNCLARLSADNTGRQRVNILSLSQYNVLCKYKEKSFGKDSRHVEKTVIVGKTSCKFRCSHYNFTSYNI